MIKSDPTLASFVRYCINNPELRFWQALKNWSGYHFIKAEQITKYEGANIAGESVQFDTYNWEGRRHDETRTSSKTG